MAKKIRLQRLNINSFCTGTGRSFGKSMSNPIKDQPKTLYPKMDELNLFGNPILINDSGPLCEDIDPMESITIVDPPPTTWNCPLDIHDVTTAIPTTFFETFPNGIPTDVIQNLEPLPYIHYELPHIDTGPDPVLNINTFNLTHQTQGQCDSLYYACPSDGCTEPPTGDTDSYVMCFTDFCESDYYVCESESDQCYTDPPDADSYVICASDWDPCDNTIYV